jgi:hypothetical protein
MLSRGFFLSAVLMAVLVGTATSLDLSRFAASTTNLALHSNGITHLPANTFSSFTLLQTL